MDQDNAELCRAVAAHGYNPVFAAHLKIVQVWRCQANDRIHAHLQQIYSLPGYSGRRPSGPVLIAHVQSAPDGSCRSFYSCLHCVESSLVAPTAPTAKDNLTDINDNNDNKLQNDGDKDEMVWMSDTLAGMMV